MVVMELNDLDRRIVEELRKDSRIPIVRLAKKLGVTPPTIYRRLRRLLDEGVIQGYTIKVDETKLERVLYALVGLETPYPEKVASALKESGEVTEIFITSGPQNVVLKVKVPNIDALNEFLRRLEGQDNVIRYQVSIILNVVKSP